MSEATCGARPGYRFAHPGYEETRLRIPAALNRPGDANIVSLEAKSEGAGNAGRSTAPAILVG
jgi:hypothetical protein